MKVDGEAVVLNLVSHKYFGLNSTGTEVWELVKTRPGISTQAIAAALAFCYDRDPAGIVEDVAALLDEMVRQNLVTACEPSVTPDIQAERCGRHYLVPRLETYGDLGTLILSGE